MLKSKSDKIALAVLIILALGLIVQDKLHGYGKSTGAKEVSSTKDIAYSVFDIGLKDNLQSIVQKLDKAQVLLRSEDAKVEFKARSIGPNSPETLWIVDKLLPEANAGTVTVCTTITADLRLKSPFTNISLYFALGSEGYGDLGSCNLSDAAHLRSRSSAMGPLLGFKVQIDSTPMLAESDPVEGNAIYTKLVDKYGKPDVTETGRGSLHGLAWDGLPKSWKDRLILEAKWKSVNEQLRYVVYSDIHSVEFQLCLRNVSVLQKYVDEAVAETNKQKAKHNAAAQSTVNKL